MPWSLLVSFVGFLCFIFFLYGFDLAGDNKVRFDHSSSGGRMAYWSGCSYDDEDVTAQYVHHPLFQANLTANKIVLKALCSTQKAVDCVAKCDVPTPQSAICGSCRNELAACVGNLTANATSMLNLTVARGSWGVDTGEKDEYVFNYTVTFNAARCRCPMRCFCPPPNTPHPRFQADACTLLICL